LSFVFNVFDLSHEATNRRRVIKRSLGATAVLIFFFAIGAEQYEHPNRSRERNEKNKPPPATFANVVQTPA
jgi:hypothetical protein